MKKLKITIISERSVLGVGARCTNNSIVCGASGSIKSL